MGDRNYINMKMSVPKIPSMIFLKLFLNSNINCISMSFKKEINILSINSTKMSDRLLKQFLEYRRKTNFLEACAFRTSSFAKIAGSITYLPYDLECQFLF